MTCSHEVSTAQGAWCPARPIGSPQGLPVGRIFIDGGFMALTLVGFFLLDAGPPAVSKYPTLTAQCWQVSLERKFVEWQSRHIHLRFFVPLLARQCTFPTLMHCHCCKKERRLFANRFASRLRRRLWRRGRAAKCWSQHLNGIWFALSERFCMTCTPCWHLYTGTV